VLIPNSVVRVTVRSVALMAVAVSLAACGSDEPASPEELLDGKTISAAAPGSDVAVGDAGACHQVDAPMMTATASVPSTTASYGNESGTAVVRRQIGTAGPWIAATYVVS
jgi:hypothetical protein